MACSTRFEANQRYGMETVWTVKNKKDPPKQVLLVAASPQPGIPRFYPVRASLAFTQDVDDVPELLHRGRDGLHGIVKL